MAPFDTLHTNFYLSSIVTMGNFSYPLVFNLHDPLEFLQIFAQNFNTNCPSPRATRRYKNIVEKFKSVPRVQQRYRRQTDRRQMDGLCLKTSIWLELWNFTTILQVLWYDFWDNVLVFYYGIWCCLLMLFINITWTFWFVWLLQSLSECIHESPNTLIFGIHNGFYGAPPDAVSDTAICAEFGLLFIVTYIRTYFICHKSKNKICSGRHSKVSRPRRYCWYFSWSKFGSFAICTHLTLILTFYGQQDL